MFGVNLLCCTLAGYIIANEPGALVGAGTWIILGVVGLWQGWYD